MIGIRILCNLTQAENEVCVKLNDEKVRLLVAAKWPVPLAVLLLYI